MSEVQDITKRRAQLSLIKRKLLEKRLQETFAGMQDQNEKVIVPRMTQEPPSLSFAQQRLWFLSQFNTEMSAYVLSSVFYLRGELNFVALEKALQAIVHRHEVLRTTFTLTKEEKLVQMIAPCAEVRLPRADLHMLPPHAREEDVRRRVNMELQKPFDLADGPLFRSTLLHFSEQEHILIIVMHHIITDGWSSGIFYRELITLYQSFSTNQPSPLHALPFQYADFALWQQQQFSAEKLEILLSYWKQQLKDMPATCALPTDYPRPHVQSFQGARESLILPQSLARSLQELCQQEHITLFMVLLTAFKILLFKWTAQPDITVGTVIAGRNQDGLENTIGCFMNFLALRSHLASEKTGKDFLSQVKDTVLQAYEYQDCPFEKIVEAVKPERKANQNPLYNVSFLLQNYPFDPFQGYSLPKLQFEAIPMKSQTSLLDLQFIIQETDNGISVICEYSTDLFEAATIKHILISYSTIVTMLLENSERRIADFFIEDELLEKAKLARLREQKQTIAIAANFTVEPIQESLDFWMQELSIPTHLKFAAYNQIFQQLADSKSLFFENTQGVNVIFLRWEDWQRAENDSNKGASQSYTQHHLSELERSMYDFLLLLNNASKKVAVPYLICLCPPSPLLAADTDCMNFFRHLEEEMYAAVEQMQGVFLISSNEILSIYPVKEYYDSDSDALGHIPYTPIFFVALGTMVARKIHALRRQPYKVLVVDCDQTLWKGICGEDDIDTLEIDATRRSLQEFIVAQHTTGMLICLCSKNNEQDIIDVFAKRSDMPLKREHIITWRINWKPKSENMSDLAAELNLSLDSFIFIDDDALECAEVQLSCPDVLVLQFPKQEEEFPSFLKQVWAFDRIAVTREDTQRSLLYRQQLQRQALHAQSFTLKDFIASLKLQIVVRAMQEEHLARVAQLTQRTNQFNCTSIRRNENELRQYCLLQERQHGECLIVEVSDRFGKYGLVGVIIFREHSNVLEVDTFLLSCRVLGRGVEHHMIARLGAIARERAIDVIIVPYIATTRSQPALDFLRELTASCQEHNEQKLLFQFSAEQLATHIYDPGNELVGEVEYKKTSALSSSARTHSHVADLLKIAQRFTDVDAIYREILLRKRAHTSAVTVLPETHIQQQLADIWQQFLHLEQVGIHDNFFTLGGTSIIGIQIVSKARQAGLPLTPIHIFEHQTIAEIAAMIDPLVMTLTGLQHQIEQEPPDLSLLPLSAEEKERVFAQKKQIEAIYPLTLVQQGILLHSLQAMDTGIYIEQFYYTLQGYLHIDSFQQAWQEVVQRHDTLRTALFWSGLDVPIQIVQHIATLPWIIQDWRDLSAASQQEQLQAFLRADRLQGFDLEQGPLMRLALLNLGQECYHIICTYHHILFDGWSMANLFTEVLRFYDAIVQSHTLSLPSPRPYHDYITWLAQQDQKASEAFWRRTLHGFSHPAKLPNIASDATKATDIVYASYEIFIRQETMKELQIVARQQQITINTLLQCVWAIVLSRYSGEEEVVFGTVVSGRPVDFHDAESMIGLFINTLPVRVQVLPSATLATWLQRVQLEQVKARQYEYSALAQIQSWSDVPHGMPLFESVLAFENYPIDTEIQRLFQQNHIQLLHASFVEQTNYPLTLSIIPEAHLHLVFSYDTKRFAENTIVQLAQNVCNLLREVAEAKADQQLHQLSLLSAAECEHILMLGHGEVEKPTTTMCLQELLNAQVRRTPQAIAVCFEHQQWTYLEIDRRANQLAHHLMQQGIAPDVLVGVCMERSVEMIIALLAILKAGGAYVPIDPSYPIERVATIIHDAQVPLLLIQSKMREVLPPLQVQVFCLDTDWKQLQHQLDTSPLVAIQPDNLVYMIYTSGSTGKPKGVMNTHRGICNRLHWMQQTYQLTTQDRILQKTPFSFDVSVWEFFWPLLQGACLVIARPDGHKDPLYLAQLIAEQDISCLHFVPSMLQAFLYEPGLEHYQYVRHVICSGEALTPALQTRFFARFPRSVQLHNLYGPTEASIDVTYWRCQPGGEGKSVPIGYAIANTHLYVLDSFLHLVPIGVEGELYIGGVGLARGYWQYPERTAEYFIPNSFSREPGERLYRTGDRGRFLPDGSIEYLGRVDRQVKVRGFRIEPGEIEAILRQHPDVLDVVVTAYEDISEGKYLVAYLTTTTSVPSVSELYTFIKGHLPNYMLPAAFVFLETMPLTSSGKVDLKALPIPDMLRPELENEFVAPSTEEEQLMATVWAEMLDLEQVGIYDDFFELGGDSLLALQLMSRLQRIFHCSFSIQVFIENPTISATLEFIQPLTASANRDDSELPKL